MKLNQNTIDTLKNFAGINTNILIKEGDELSTISTMRNIFAKAKISDQFTKEFGIYDLNEFLSVLSGFNKPEVSLQDKNMLITAEGSRKTKYWYSDPSVIVSPTKEVNMPDLALVGTKGGDIVLKVCDKKNDTSNTFEIIVGKDATADYTFYFKVENMKMMEGDYDVAVSSKSISHFKNKKLPVEYWIALEPDSTITK